MPNAPWLVLALLLILSLCALKMPWSRCSLKMAKRFLFPIPMFMKSVLGNSSQAVVSSRPVVAYLVLVLLRKSILSNPRELLSAAKSYLSIGVFLKSSIANERTFKMARRIRRSVSRSRVRNSRRGTSRRSNRVKSRRHSAGKSSFRRKLVGDRF